MGKISQKSSHVQCEKPGCMWSIMRMLDFRYARITNKLLLDRRFESRNRAGSRKVKSKHDTMMTVDEINEVTSDCEENVEITCRPSVKDLIEEDLLNEQLSKSDDPTYCAVSELPSYNGDIGRTIDEFCHQRNRNCAKNDQGNDEMHQLDNQSPELEEKLKEILTLFISQRLAGDRNHQAEDNFNEDVHHSQELRDALRIISSDAELVLQFLQGERSFLGKYIEKKMRNSQVQNDEEHSPEHASEVSAAAAGTTKQRKFFRKKSKSLEMTVPLGNNLPQATNRIVILKPGLQNMETKIGLVSSHQSEMNKGGIERSNSSHFFLTEIKRRLRNAMGRERQEGSNNRHNGRSSAAKEHFFTEIIARHPMSFNKRKNSSAETIECNKGKEHQEVGNNLWEAKKHLSEVLTNYPNKGEIYPKAKPLGRILSFPEHNSSSSCCSSGNDFWYGFVPARMSLPNIEKFQRRGSNLGRISLCSDLSDDDNSSDNKAQASSDPSSSTLQELSLPHSEFPVDDGGEKNVDEATIEDFKFIASEEMNVIDDTCETSSCTDTVDEKNGDSCEVHDERIGSELSDHESSPSKRSHDLESNDLLGRPSPISVLDQIFVEEDISPAATRYQSGVQPRRIQFEEEVDSFDSTDEDIHLKTSTESAAKDCIFEFIKIALLSSGLNWEELYLTSDSPDQILDPSSCDDFELFPNQLCHDKKLLFDCTDEALAELYERYFSCSPGLSLGKPPIRPVPDIENTIHEVWETVYWHLLPLPAPHSLEQIVTKDMDRNSSNWMDLRGDAQTVIFEIGEAIFDDLVEGSILGYCVNKWDDGECFCINF